MKLITSSNLPPKFPSYLEKTTQEFEALNHVRLRYADQTIIPFTTMPTSNETAAIVSGLRHQISYISIALFSHAK